MQFLPFDVFAMASAALSTLFRTTAWLRGPPSSATSSAVAAAAIKARFDSIDARLATLSRDAHAAAHAAMNQMPSAISANPKRASPKRASLAAAEASQAGPGVTILAPTCDVPYSTARSEMKAIGMRLVAIGNSIKSADMKEAFIAEKRLADWERIIPHLDGFVDERQLSEDKWRAANNSVNEAALRRVLSCMPVNVACLSEDRLTGLMTPSGRAFPATLAYRLRESAPILELFRATDKIEPMHPSVLRRLSSHGLSLLELRALYQALQTPALAWRNQLKKQQPVESSWGQLSPLESKLDWYQQLADRLMRVSGSEPDESSFGLYAEPLGFPTHV